MSMTPFQSNPPSQTQWRFPSLQDEVVEEEIRLEIRLEIGPERSPLYSLLHTTASPPPIATPTPTLTAATDPTATTATTASDTPTPTPLLPVHFSFHSFLSFLFSPTFFIPFLSLSFSFIFLLLSDTWIRVSRSLTISEAE